MTGRSVRALRSTGRRRTVRGPSAVRPSVLLVLAGLVAVAVACVPSPPPLDDRAADLEALAPLELDGARADATARRAREVTVRIRSLGCDRLGVGSGFVLPGGLIVTNRHVVGTPRTIEVSTWDGVALEVTVDGVALDSDLAVLRTLEAESLPSVELREATAVVGEPVIVVGYPEGGPSTITTGRVVAVQDGELFGEPAEVLVIDAAVREGNSGGPVLDADGLVIGVVFARDPDAELGLAVPVATLLARLDAAVLAPPGGC